MTWNIGFLKVAEIFKYEWVLDTIFNEQFKLFTDIFDVLQKTELILMNLTISNEHIKK